jgi:hypothetical protein
MVRLNSHLFLDGGAVAFPDLRGGIVNFERLRRHRQISYSIAEGDSGRPYLMLSLEINV